MLPLLSYKGVFKEPLQQQTSFDFCCLWLCPEHEGVPCKTHFFLYFPGTRKMAVGETRKFSVIKTKRKEERERGREGRREGRK
jgi:hypothetical protein